LLAATRQSAAREQYPAAGVWLTAAVGAAAGASLPLLALATTVAYFVVVFELAPLARRLPASPYAPSAVRVVYEDGRGILRQILAISTSRDFKVADVDIDRTEGVHEGHAGAVGVALEVHGPGSIAQLAATRGEIDGVLSVAAGDVNEMFD
jgi:putative Mg2+ transporter-C (MgtC) family protein